MSPKDVTVVGTIEKNMDIWKAWVHLHKLNAYDSASSATVNQFVSKECMPAVNSKWDK